MAERSFTSELLNRCLWGGLSLGVLALFIWLGPYPNFRPLFGIALAVVTLTALWEYYKLAKTKAPLTIPFALGCGLFYLLIHYLQTQRFMGSVPSPSIFALGVTLFALFLYNCALPKAAITSLATAFFGIVYVVIPLSWALDLLYLTEDGRFWLSYVILVTVLTDTGAYFSGKLLGRHRLWPTLSPKKTIEGGIGGVIFAIGVSIAMASIWGPLSYTAAAILGAILGIVGQVGDLAESLLKRDASVKDSNKLPGLGGMLDVVDSLLFTIPVTLIAIYFL